VSMTAGRPGIMTPRIEQGGSNRLEDKQDCSCEAPALCPLFFYMSPSGIILKNYYY
jgi:hypothetical protein